MKILLTIEEPVLAELLAFRLELLGHQVEIRSTAAQMHISLQDTEYTMAIIDTALPDSNVRDALVKLRSRWSKERLPVIVISVDQSLEMVEQVIRSGADDYLLAPFDPQVLQNKLNKLLHTTKLARV